MRLIFVARSVFKSFLVHILFLTDNFPPEVNAPASRSYEHCREWVVAGHEVTVITCVPNFPNGRVFSGYRNRIYQSEIISNIKVVRVWSYITANSGFLKRILDYISFMFMAVFFGLFVKRVDLIVGTSPQFFTVFGAHMLSVFKRKPWVFELRDIWPESIRAVGVMRQSRTLDFLEKVELFLYRRAIRIVSVTHSFKESLINRGIDGSKINVITNGVDLARFKPAQKNSELLLKHKIEGSFIVGYIGTHGMAHSLETLLAAAKILKEQYAAEDIHFLMLGDGANKNYLLERAQKEEIDNVLFVDSVSKDDVVEYWSLLDVSIIHLKKSDLFKMVIPSKIFESMAMGVPIAHGVFGESSSIIREDQIGLVFEPENAQSLVDVLLRFKRDLNLISNCRKNCLRAAKHYDRKRLAVDMLKILESVVDP